MNVISYLILSNSYSFTQKRLIYEEKKFIKPEMNQEKKQQHCEFRIMHELNETILSQLL